MLLGVLTTHSRVRAHQVDGVARPPDVCQWTYFSADIRHAVAPGDGAHRRTAPSPHDVVVIFFSSCPPPASETSSSPMPLRGVTPTTTTSTFVRRAAAPATPSRIKTSTQQHLPPCPTRAPIPTRHLHTPGPFIPPRITIKQITHTKFHMKAQITSRINSTHPHPTPAPGARATRPS